MDLVIKQPAAGPTVLPIPTAATTVALPEVTTPARTSLAMLETGNFACSSCAREVPLSGHPMLEFIDCPHCQSTTLVPKKIGKYWLCHLLGGGGMGRAYQAFRDGDPDTLFAVKILPRGEQQNQKLVENLRDEYEFMTAIGHHPCLVSALECGSADGELFLAMHYVPGERLDHRIERLGALPESEVLFTALRIISAEMHIYKRGYLFRDLKPENIIIGSEGAILYDYGICMPIDEALEDPGDLIEGSPLYIPPERLTGEGERPSSEIYSLGMVLYHALTGRTIFKASGIENTALQHVEQGVRRTNLSKTMPHIDPRWEQILDRMIARTPKKRFQTFLEVETEFVRILSARLEHKGFERFFD